MMMMITMLITIKTIIKKNLSHSFHLEELFFHSFLGKDGMGRNNL